MKDKDDELNDAMRQYWVDQTKLKATKHYVDITLSYDFNNLPKDMKYIFGSIDQLIDIIKYADKNIPKDFKEIHKAIDEQYWIFKYLSNIVTFIDIMKPITKHINPTDEDKAKFVEFIKKMEEDNDDN